MKWTRALATAAKSVEKGSLRWIGRGLLRNAAAEALNKLYKKELIWRRGPWTGADAVEIATLEWVDWYNCETAGATAGGSDPWLQLTQPCWCPSCGSVVPAAVVVGSPLAEGSDLIGA